MQIKIIGSANMSQARGEFKKLEVQVKELNSELARSTVLADSVNPDGYARMQRAVAQGSTTFRNAAASMGQYSTETRMVASQTEKYTDLVNKQKLTFKDWAKQRKLANAAYKEQLALQNAVVRQAGTASVNGRRAFDIAVPGSVSKEFDTMGQKVGWFSKQLQSSSHQLINWGKNTQWAGRQLMVGFTVPLAAFGAATAVMAYQVDKNMTRIMRVYDTTANANSASLKDQMAVEKELANVRQAASKTSMDAAKQYGASAKDVLDVQAELAATGIKGAELQKNTLNVVKAATLGEMDYQTALQSTITLQTVFNQTADQTGDSFNYLTAVANATSLDMNDFAKAIPIAAAPIKLMGGDLQTLGTLLTAMKSRGIAAAEGANAIKSAMQRLYRPSKQIQDEFKAITGASILDVRDKNKGNLVGMLQEINTLTQDLSKPQKIQVFAGLFGTYQVTRMTAMLDGLNDLKNGVGQTTDAFKIGEEGTAAWSKTTEQATQRFQQAISTKFKMAVATLQNELIPVGETFLKIGTAIVEVTSKFAALFNAMPGWVKFAAVSVAIGTAIAGVGLMMTGLFANLFGNILKGIGTLGVLATRFGIVTRESKIAQLAVDSVSSAFISEARAAELLTIQLRQLAQAQEAAAAATMSAMTNGRATVASMASSTAGAAQTAAARTPSVITNNNGVYRNSQGQFAARADYDRQQRALAVERRNQERIERDGAAATEAAAKSAQRQRLAIAGSAASALVAAGAMVAMTTSSNETVQNMAQFALIGSSLIPIMSAIGGPITLAIGAVGALGLALYKVHQNHEKAIKKQIDDQKALNDTTGVWVSTLDIAGKKMKSLTLPAIQVGSAPATTVDQNVSKLKAAPGGEDLIKSYKDADGTFAKNTIALKQYLLVLRQTNGDSAKARRAIETLFVAAGEGAVAASLKAVTFTETLQGVTKQAANSKLWSREIQEAMTGAGEVVQQRGKNLGLELGSAIASGTTTAAKNKPMATAIAAFASQWDYLFTHVDESSKKIFSQIGVNSGESFKKAFEMFTKNRAQFEKEYLSGQSNSSQRQIIDAFQRTNDNPDRLRQITQVKGAEKAVVAELAKGLHIEENITTLKQLQATAEYKLATLTNQHNKATLNNAREIYAQLVEQKGGQDKLSGAQELVLLNQVRQQLGLKTTNYLAQNFNDLLNAGANGINDQTNNQVRLNNALKVGRGLASLPAEQQKTVMGGVQSDIADQMRSDFESQMNASMKSRQAYWDNRSQALSDSLDKMDESAEKRADAMQRALDAKFERRTNSINKYYDNRIAKIDTSVKAEQKADDVRERIFQAEQTRMQRMTDAQNKNIDFNVALNSGNLDEAAKIRNDMEATAFGNTLEDAGAEANRRSEAKQERLGNLKDELEKERDLRLKALDKQKERESRALKNRIDAEKKNLERIRRIRERALSQETTADIDALQGRWDRRKKELDNEMALFLAYTARNKKDLQRHMAQLGLSYDRFGIDLQKKGGRWAKFFGDSLAQRIKEARLTIASDKGWENMGKRVGNATAKGMGFKNVQDWKSWWKQNGAMASTGAANPNRPHVMPGGEQVTRHQGGWIDSSPGSRKGVARTQRGNHPSEVNVRARKGEFMVNEKAAAKNADALERMNSGRSLDDQKKGIFGGVGAGITDAAFGMAVQMSRTMAAATNNLKAKIAAASAMAMGAGSFMSGRPGVYGDRGFSAEQLKNAATIASVGSSMGLSKRDIEIGIMTAITESGLINVNYGDRDSLGLFQQRPSQGWGTPEQVTDPEYASRTFFSRLRNVGDRSRMSPWLAAQAVQRSAYSDGSNYAQNWNEAIAILTKGLTAQDAAAGGGYVPGPGGKHRPVNSGSPGSIHDAYTGFPAVDIPVPVGTSVYAVGDGRITRSQDLRGNEPRNAAQNGYYSYGRVMQLKLDAGPEVLYAHLSSRGLSAGSKVDGGSVIAKSGNTGHSTGPHLHFGARGASPLAYMEKGGFTQTDGLAYLHAGESVVTKPLTDAFIQGIQNFSGGWASLFNNASPVIQSMMGQLLKQVVGGVGSVGSMTDSGPTGTAGVPATSTPAAPTSTVGPGTGKEANLRTGTLNAHTYGASPARTIQDLKKAMSRVDTLALQEWMVGDRSKEMKYMAAQNWGIYRGPTGTAIAWDKDKYTGSNFGYEDLNKKYRMPSKTSQRYAVYGLLRDNETGGKFWETSVHLIPGTGYFGGSISNGTREAILREQYERLGALTDRLDNSAPVVVGGDFNDRSMGKIKGLRSSSNGKEIDQIYSSLKSAGGVANVLSSAGLATDHPYVWNNYKLPGMAKGGYTLSDGMAMLHKKETVLTAPLTQQLHDGIERFANGGDSTYYINVYGNDLSAKDIADQVMNKIERREARKPQGRKGR